MSWTYDYCKKTNEDGFLRMISNYVSFVFLMGSGACFLVRRFIKNCYNLKINSHIPQDLTIHVTAYFYEVQTFVRVVAISSPFCLSFVENIFVEALRLSTTYWIEVNCDTGNYVVSIGYDLFVFLPHVNTVRWFRTEIGLN